MAVNCSSVILLFLKCIYTCPDVINKTNCFHYHFHGSVLAGVFRTMGPELIEVKQCTANEKPICGRVAAALSCAKIGIRFAMLDKLISYAMLCFEIISSFF